MKPWLTPTTRTFSGTRTGSANAGNFFVHRLLPVAASLLAALGIAWYGQLKRSSEAGPRSGNFRHIYREAAYLERERPMSLTLVNGIMDTAVGAELATNPSVQNLEITFADRCQVARRDSFHLIVQGDNGPVTLLMVPDSTTVNAEFTISDDRFQGVLAPVNGGNLAVVGEGAQELGEYRDLISQNIRWKH